MKIAILGWGSLLWDSREDFDARHGEWFPDGPTIPLEFSRVSESRGNALTLVLDKNIGHPCQVSYALSHRTNPDDAICDLRSREGTSLANIGYLFLDGSRIHGGDPESVDDIRKWGYKKAIDVVIWTDLKSNFEEKATVKFSIDEAISYLQQLDPHVKSKAAEYIWRAPDFVRTPLRAALQTQPWFKPT